MKYKEEIAKIVNPYIGTIGTLLTATKPIVSLPHGMMQAYPFVGEEDGERYIKDCFEGMKLESIIVLPDADMGNEGIRDCFSHELENVHPYEYRVLLEKSRIKLKCTVTARGFYSQMFYPANEKSFLYIKGAEGLEAEQYQTNAVKVKVKGKNEFYFVELNKEICSVSKTTYHSQNGKKQECIRIGFESKKIIELRIGMSYISFGHAMSELEARKRQTYTEIMESSKNVWNKALARIQVKGGTKEKRIIFYTAMYRSLLQMRNITEDGQYRGYDGNVHEAGEHDYYVSDNLWDSFRCKHPLQLLMEPSVQEDMIESYVRMYEQSGWLPQFPEYTGDRNVMLGNHAAAMVLDTVAKGYSDFRLEKAYEGLKKNSLFKTKLPWTAGEKTELDDFYFEHGFFPALNIGEAETCTRVHNFERRQAVSVTLDYSYDDWCMSRIADYLSLDEEREMFEEQAGFYRNMYNPETGFMSPKNKDGKWVEGFQPKLSGGLGGRDYFTECNSWIFTFFIPHDIPGLQELMGGEDIFEEKLDRLFTEGHDVPRFRFLGQFPDSTGLIGQYCHGNEPAFHIPFLYNYTKSPWKTQKMVRRILDVWYSNSPMGLCGDDDEGALSSWYVWAAIGLYPICVGEPRYALSTPLFEEIEIFLEDGGKFTIKTDKKANINKYIQKIFLNGEPYESLFLSDAVIRAGGSITLNIEKYPLKTKENRR